MSQLEQKATKKKKKEVKLEFEAGKVFKPSEAKDQDFDLDLDSARYKARKGEGGDRRG
jgi:hypothetical protein